LPAPGYRVDRGGLSADEAPEQPSDTILFDSIGQFKGLERQVVAESGR
jgi:hypothetical protein